MSECKDERIGGNPGKPSLKIPLSSIKSIIQMIKCAFKIPEIPLPIITAREIEIGSKFRPGVSKTDTVSRVLTKAASVGIATGPNNDGTPNKSNISKRIMVDEIIDELLYRSKIEVVIPTGGLTLQIPFDGALSVTPSGVIVGSITNLSGPIKAEGIIR